MAFFMSMFGMTFVLVGFGCVATCDERERGLGFLVCGLLILMPGIYGSVTLVSYLMGRKGYHFRDLPEMD
jgi:hypothetical protein